MKMTNVAAFKSVTMSSEYSPHTYMYSPHYAVDDRVFNTLWGEQCACTDFDAYPWMIIDMENIFEVNYVTLFNRIDELGKKAIACVLILLNSKLIICLTYNCEFFQWSFYNIYWHCTCCRLTFDFFFLHFLIS